MMDGKLKERVVLVPSEFRESLISSTFTRSSDPKREYWAPGWEFQVSVMSPVAGSAENPVMVSGAGGVDEPKISISPN
jgi:phage baseplate assembly protein gpV